MTTKQTPTIADLQGQLEAAREATEGAQAHKAELWARVDAGDATIDGTDLQKADIEAERLSRLQKAAAAALNAAIEAQSLPKTPTIAIADDHQGVALLAAQTILARGLVKSNIIVGGDHASLDRAELPTLAIKGGKINDYGSGVSGPIGLNLTFVARTTSDPVPDLTAIKASLKTIGMGLTKDTPASTTSRSWSTTIDSDRATYRAKIGLTRAWEAIPMITPGTWRAPFGWSFGDNAHPRLAIDKALGTGLGTTTIAFDLVELDHTIADGIVTTTVAIRASVKAAASSVKEPLIRRTIEQTWPELIGSFDTHFGTFTAIEPAPGTPTWASELPAADQNETDYHYTSNGMNGVRQVGDRNSYNLHQNGLGVFYATATAVRRASAEEVAA